MEDRKVIQGVVSAEMELRSRGSRIGHAQRAQAEAHIERMLKDGYLNGKDAGARANYIRNAETAEQLYQALSDLPPYPEPRVPLRAAWRNFDWDKKECYVPVLALCGMMSVLFAATPFIILSALGLYHDNALMTATGVPAIIIGVIGLIFSIGVLIDKSC